jgi:predicted RecA/RadA family phage recombinase
MATNKKFDSAKTLVVPVPVGTVSGDPVVYGNRPGVALTTRDAAGNATVQFDGVFTLSVKGVNGTGNVAVAAGDILYHVAADTPKLSKKDTGVRFGYAMGAVTTGTTSTIDVILGT